MDYEVKARKGKMVMGKVKVKVKVKAVAVAVDSRPQRKVQLPPSVNDIPFLLQGIFDNILQIRLDSVFSRQRTYPRAPKNLPRTLKRRLVSHCTLISCQAQPSL
jgi:hypothetical protein